MILYRKILMLAIVKWGHALTGKFRKIKHFGAFWCRHILYLNQTSMKFTTNDSAARKQ